MTKVLLSVGFPPGFSKIVASGAIFILNFAGRRFFVFPEPNLGPWKRQISKT
jgi:hypothetical protein